jgi:hypothetical protein
MHLCVRKILVSVPSFSLFIFPRNRNDRWIVSECVSMSICEATISNLSRDLISRDPFLCVSVCVFVMYV